MRNGILAGTRHSDKAFDARGYYALLWSSSDDDTSAWYRYLTYRKEADYKNTYNKLVGFSTIYKIKGE